MGEVKDDQNGSQGFRIRMKKQHPRQTGCGAGLRL
jgi:hypothetical protein